MISMNPNQRIMLSLMRPFVNPRRKALTGITSDSPFSRAKMISTLVKAIHLGKTVLPKSCSQNQYRNTGSISTSDTGTSQDSREKSPSHTASAESAYPFPCIQEKSVRIIT